MKGLKSLAFGLSISFVAFNLSATEGSIQEKSYSCFGSSCHAGVIYAQAAADGYSRDRVSVNCFPVGWFTWCSGTAR